MVDAHFGGSVDGLLGELQFAFLAFVFVQSLDSYAQWKALVVLALGCQEAALHTWRQSFVTVKGCARKRGVPGPWRKVEN